MRRGRWVAALVLLGAGMVISRGARDVVYERRTSEDAVVYYERRWDWMPVGEFTVPDHLCTECQLGEHGQCSEPDRIVERNARWGSFPALRLLLNRAGEIRVLDWQCSCADCSHTDVSG